MRAFAFVLLAAAAVTAYSDPYTIGQVASGLTHGGVVTGVDYSNGVVSGVGAIGNRAYAGHVGYAGVGHLGYANHVVAAPAAYSGVVAAPSVYSSVVPTTSIHGYAGHYYGKREAEADSDADAYTIGQVAAGLPVHNAYATGHPHNVGVVTGTTYSAPVHHGYTAYAAPAYTHAAYGYSGVHAYATPAIHGYAGGYYGKREADSDADAYTIGQVAAGLPVHNAYATGHPHNVGVVTGTTYSAPVHHGYTAYAAPAYTHAAYGYSGVHAYATPAIHGYAGHYYGKREAEAKSDADAYTIGQVAAGLPVHNAYATGHPHNVGVVTGTTYSAPVHHGYTAYAAPTYTGYAGHLGYAGLGYAGLGYTGAYYG